MQPQSKPALFRIDEPSQALCLTGFLLVTGLPNNQLSAVTGAAERAVNVFGGVG